MWSMAQSTNGERRPSSARERPGAPAVRLASEQVDRQPSGRRGRGSSSPSLMPGTEAPRNFAQLLARPSSASCAMARVVGSRARRRAPHVHGRGQTRAAGRAVLRPAAQEDLVETTTVEGNLELAQCLLGGRACHVTAAENGRIVAPDGQRVHVEPMPLLGSCALGWCPPSGRC